MSLVNNMLRDLDQRRKDSGSSDEAVRLMPAREFVESSKKNPLPLVVAGLLLTVAALVYFWAQLSNSSGEQQLDIQVQPLASNTAADPEQLIQQLEESIVQAQIAANAEPAPTQPETQAELSAAPATPPAVEPSSPAPEPVQNSAPAEQPAPVVSVAGAPASTESAAVAPDPNLVRGAGSGSVKEAPEYSNEQMDKIAVQTALRQIADGQTEAADKTLAEYISANRYAHQSRETYAKLLMSRGRVADAGALIDAGLEMAPNHSGFKKVKARLLMADGKVADAASILISRAPSVVVDPEYHDLLASAQLASRDFSGAMISYRGLVQLDETQGKWWYGFAAAHDQLGNIQQARQAYSQAMQYANLSASLRRRSQERLSALNP